MRIRRALSYRTLVLCRVSPKSYRQSRRPERSISPMKRPNPPTTSQKLASAAEQARVHLASAETTVQTAKQESRAARHKRKMAREAVRRTKKKLKQARKALAEARRALAKAEEKLAGAASRAVKAKKQTSAPPPAKASASKIAKKPTKRAVSHARGARPAAAETVSTPEPANAQDEAKPDAPDGGANGA